MGIFLFNLLIYIKISVLQIWYSSYIFPLDVCYVYFKFDCFLMTFTTTSLVQRLNVLMVVNDYSYLFFSFNRWFLNWSIMIKICLQCRRYGSEPWVRKIPLQKEMATQSNVLAWEIPWTEEPGRLQFTGSQKRHNWVTKHTYLIYRVVLVLGIVLFIALNIAVIS